MRKTSIDAFKQIKDEGLLPEKQFKVYEILHQFGPMTAQEAWVKYREVHRTKQRDGITPRFSELKMMGVIGEKGKRPCGVTGRSAIEWDVSGRLPKKPTQVQIVKKRIRVLEEKLIQAKRELKQIYLKQAEKDQYKFDLGPIPKKPPKRTMSHGQVSETR